MAKRLDDATKKTIACRKDAAGWQASGRSSRESRRGTADGICMERMLDEGGIDALRAVPSRGRPAKLDATQLEGVRSVVLQSPTEHGFGTELWTLNRVGAVIERLYGVRFGTTQLWRILGAMGFSVQKPGKRVLERNEDAVRQWKRRTWPALKKNQQEGRVIVFVDESGISERPTRVRTWAPKGCTPIIQFHFKWTHVSVIAGLTRTNCLFRLHERSIKKEQVVEFLKALKSHLKQPLLVILDGLRAHRSKLVREYLDGLDGHIQLAFLPPYAPDMNPVEYLWALYCVFL